MKHIAKGIGVSVGKVRGRVRIIKNFSDHKKFSEGDILVTHITDPTMVILMNKASGIICNVGSIVSHPSIVAREIGIPCIVSAKCIETGKQATEILNDGDIVEICGETGNIHKITEENNGDKIQTNSGLQTKEDIDKDEGIDKEKDETRNNELDKEKKKDNEKDYERKEGWKLKW